tara:strand:- start:3020 stop:3316 length:297 start_codon:yes stop_codon:yes gene_type:complete
MTVQEVMERVGMNDTGVAVAWIKDAIHLIQSQYDDNVSTWKTDITKASASIDNKYGFPVNLIKLKSISIKDTQDGNKYKKIRRITVDPVVVEDTEPNA